MQIIPAVDIHRGRCVRLLMGQRDKETIYSDNPEEVALRWQSEGAGRLHVVDLDGAFEGKPSNLSIIKKIALSLDIPIQVGGGIRDKETVEKILEAGASRVILGTVAVEEPELLKELLTCYGSKIIVGIDAREGVVAVKGWTKGSEKNAVNLAREMEELGVGEIIYTDICRDGTLKGPNLVALEQMARALDIPVIASGGVSSLEDLQRLKELEPLGVRGVIIGQALYSGRLTLREALKIVL